MTPVSCVLSLQAYNDISIYIEMRNCFDLSEDVPDHKDPFATTDWIQPYEHLIDPADRNAYTENFATYYNSRSFQR